jgi:hypothetical protein
MKTIRKNKSVRLRRLEMYRHDLEELYELFLLGCESVTVSDGTIECETLNPFDEMKDRLGNRVKNLEIMGHEPEVHFLLNQVVVTPGFITATKYHFNELRTEEPSDEADSLYFKLKEFLEAKQRPYVPRLQLFIPAIIALCCAFIWSVSNLLQGIPPGPTVVGELKFFGPTLLILLFVLLLLLSTARRDLIYLTTRSESPTFWERTKDDILVRTLVALVSSAIAGIVGFLIGRLSKH